MTGNKRSFEGLDPVSPQGTFADKKAKTEPNPPRFHPNNAYQIVPEGDLILYTPGESLRGPVADAGDASFLVSSTHMKLASPYFKARLSTRWLMCGSSRTCGPDVASDAQTAHTVEQAWGAFQTLFHYARAKDQDSKTGNLELRFIIQDQTEMTTELYDDWFKTQLAAKTSAERIGTKIDELQLADAGKKFMKNKLTRVLGELLEEEFEIPATPAHIAEDVAGPSSSSAVASSSTVVAGPSSSVAVTAPSSAVAGSSAVVAVAGLSGPSSFAAITGSSSSAVIAKPSSSDGAPPAKRVKIEPKETSSKS
ncbi:hypothetical protein N7541_000950 [Penicillium brevicompactum]|uniref:Uncharacterized protein n=1 Tax=Penicillium brevicompactum TaxID=5074 RepID=A0A9W9RXR5_PENBR|nr:hypothetical protein N7541_000950 [Penicillium brevicompactum]